MGRYLNVGVLQIPVSTRTADNLKYIEERVAGMMSAYHKPELIVGVECISCMTGQRIPGPMTDFFAGIAKKYGIYFIPGTIYEKSDDLPEGMYYNSAPIFNPKGEMVDNYRKIAPWAPSEAFAVPGNRYVVFEIPEKRTKVGVQICYDSNFPEISRTLTLMGAEVIVKLTMDPEELYELNRPVHFTRALENQAYFISVNGVGMRNSSNLYGKSIVISPEGKALWEAGNVPAVATVTLDLDLVTKCRKYGTIFMDHYVQHLRDFNIQSPYANCLADAPVYRDLETAPKNVDEYEVQVKQEGVCEMGNRILLDVDVEADQRAVEEFLKSR